MSRGKARDKQLLETLRRTLVSNPADVDAANRYWTALGLFQSGHHVIEAFREAAISSNEGVVAFAQTYTELFKNSGEPPRAVYFDKQLVRALEASAPKSLEKDRSTVQWILESLRGRPSIQCHQRKIRFGDQPVRELIPILVFGRRAQ